VQINALGLNWPCNVGGWGLGAYIQVSDLRAIMALLLFLIEFQVPVVIATDRINRDKNKLDDAYGSVFSNQMYLSTVSR
jgi:hypothetical protein